MNEHIRILAVDDDTNHLASVRRVLKRSQIEVVTASSGAQALKRVASWIPDLLLVDASMPCMSGNEFVRRFRKFESHFHTQNNTRHSPPAPILFLSARTGKQHRIDCLDAGAVDYLLKPFDPDELRARVRCHLRQARYTQIAHGLKHNHSSIAPSSGHGAAA